MNKLGKDVKTRFRDSGGLGVILIALGFIIFGTATSLLRTTDFIIFSIFVLGFDLLYGHMGRLSFGHMLFFGSGAYAAGLLVRYATPNPFLAILAGICGGALVGGILGPVVVRATGACFALINLAFNQVGYFLALVAFAKSTGGEDGLSLTFSSTPLLDITRPKVFFGFALFCLCLVYYLLKRLTSSPYGILLRTIRENETRAQFIGYNTYRYKWITFVISASISAFAGALATLNYGYVNPSFVDPTRNVEVIFAALIGGAGSLYGAVIGGFSYMVISNYLARYIPRWEMFLGFALLILVFKFREGIWGNVISVWKRRTQTGE
ncbi:MAG: branched-chain amino acid ABC transporter permease [Thermodesulfobacteriota bacterium]